MSLRMTAFCRCYIDRALMRPAAFLGSGPRPVSTSERADMQPKPRRSWRFFPSRPTLYRALAVTLVVTAIASCMMSKGEIKAFLCAALLCAVAAGDIELSKAIISVLRLWRGPK
jgi:hypothetical protein